MYFCKPSKIMISHGNYSQAMVLLCIFERSAKILDGILILASFFFLFDLVVLWLFLDFVVATFETTWNYQQFCVFLCYLTNLFFFKQKYTITLPTSRWQSCELETLLSKNTLRCQGYIFCALMFSFYCFLFFVYPQQMIDWLRWRPHVLTLPLR